MTTTKKQNNNKKEEVKEVAVTATTATEKGKKEKAKIALLNYKNSEVLSLLFDKSNYRLPALKNAVSACSLSFNIQPNEVIENIIAVCNMIILDNSTLPATATEEMKGFKAKCKTIFTEAVQESSRNTFRRFVQESLKIAYTQNIKAVKESQTATFCEKSVTTSFSVSKFYNSFIWQVITHGGRDYIGYDSILNCFTITTNTAIEE